MEKKGEQRKKRIKESDKMGEVKYGKTQEEK